MEVIVTLLDLLSTCNEAFWLFLLADVIFERRPHFYKTNRLGRLLPVLPMAFYAVVVIVMNNLTELTSPYTLPVVMVCSIIWICVCWKSDFLSALAVVGCYGLLLMLESSFLAVLFGSIGGAEILREAAYEKGFSRLLLLTGGILIWFLVSLWLYRFIRKRTWNRNSVRYIAVISLLGYVALLFLLMQMLNSFQVHMNGYFIGVLIVLGACIFFPYGIARYQALSRQMQETEAYNSLLEESYERVNHFYMDNARLYHDMNHHLQAIAYMLESGEAKEAQEYIESLGDFQSDYRKNNYTGNELIDMILSEKKRVAETKNLLMNIHTCVLPQAMNIEKKDLCAVFSNLLDNALESSEQQISVQIRTSGRMLMLEIQNDYKNPPVIRNGGFLTNKPNPMSHGFGLRNVQSITEKYDGTFHCETEGNLFRIQILLCF